MRATLLVRSFARPAQQDETGAEHDGAGQAVALDAVAEAPDGRPTAEFERACGGVDEGFEQRVDGFGEPVDFHAGSIGTETLRTALPRGVA